MMVGLGSPFDGNKENMNLESVMLPTRHDDVSGMPDSPPKYTGHRRAHSEAVTLLDDISFDSDLGVVASQDTKIFLFSSKTTTPTPPPENHHLHSSDVKSSRVNTRLHSMSMDDSTSTTFNQEETLTADTKKWMSANKLADLALVDPKRVKRIWENRQSAARSKQRKIFYIAELERKGKFIHCKQKQRLFLLNCLFCRNVHVLTAENNDLKMRLQAMVQQAHLQDAISDALKKEIHNLKVVTGQNLTNGGPIVNFPPLFGQFQPNNQPVHTMLTSLQFQQLKILQFQQLKIRSQNQNNVFQPQPLHQFQHRFQQQ